MEPHDEPALYDEHGVLVTRRIVRSHLGTFLLTEARGVRVDVQRASLLGPLMLFTSAGVVALVSMTMVGLGLDLVGMLAWATIGGGLVLALVALALLVWAAVHAAGLRPTHVVLLDLGAMRRVAVERDRPTAERIRLAIEQALQRAER